jgi:hypothetical protein
MLQILFIFCIFKAFIITFLLLDNFLEGCCHLGLNLFMMLVAKCYYVKKVENKL